MGMDGASTHSTRDSALARAGGPSSGIDLEVGDVLKQPESLGVSQALTKSLAIMAPQVSVLEGQS